MADSEIMILNDYGTGSLTRRTSTTGRSRYTVEIKAEPILIQTSAKALGAGPAQAIAAHLKERVADISAPASKATMKARLSAQKALIAGESWAQKRYGGGRLGTRAPARSDRLFNDSGRLIESIAVGTTSRGYVINVAGNRFDASTLDGGEAVLVRIVARLRDLVPEFGDPRLLLDSLPVQRALREGLADALQKSTDRGVELKKQLMGMTVGRLLRLVA